MAQLLPPHEFPKQQDRRNFESWLQGCAIRRNSHNLREYEAGKSIIENILTLEGSPANRDLYRVWLVEFVKV